MRSAAAIAAVTAVFAGVLVGGLSRTGALDPALLQGTKEDHAGAGTVGWKMHSLPAAGFAVKLPPEWRLVTPSGKVQFEERDGRKPLASLTVAPADGSGAQRAPRGMVSKRFAVDDHVLTFTTTTRLAASYRRVFEHAADSFRTLSAA
jgi:hypothetical protein